MVVLLIVETKRRQSEILLFPDVMNWFRVESGPAYRAAPFFAVSLPL